VSAEASVILPRTKSADAPWGATRGPVVIGKDVLELLSSSMYVDAMSIFREYVQNSADAIDQRKAQGHKATGRINIQVDPNERRIVFRDNGIGVPAVEFATRLVNLGASTKRGTTARGFRGVGRLAGLGYCQELVFRAQAEGEKVISEMRWDCRRLKALLRAAGHDSDIVSVVREVVTARSLPASKEDDHFFEVEMRGVIRQNSDRLLSTEAIRDYLSQVAPVPFSPDFSHGADIAATLSARDASSTVEITINNSPDLIYRPHRDTYEHGNGAPPITLKHVEFHELPGVDGDIAAVVWVAHHEYAGAIPAGALIRGLRVRVGNIQIGEQALFEELFPETRFNSWAVGEINVIDRKLLPNGRRDHFEQSVHFENLQNQLAPIVREIARQCRHSSVSRKWVKAFELHKLNATERAKIVARGGVSKSVAHLQANAAKTSLKAMHRVVQQKYLTDEIRASMTAEAARVEARVQKMIKGAEGERNPLAHFKPAERRVYEQVIGMIYENFKNRAAAGVLVEKILSRLESQASKAASPAVKPKKKGRARSK